MSEPAPLTPRRFRRIEWLIAFAAFWLLAVFVYPAYTLSSETLFLRPWVDGMSSEFGFYPWDRFIADRLADGELPLWNPFEAAGAPLVANYQSSVFYPLQLLVYAFDAVDALLLLKIALAALFTYRYCRLIRLSRIASVVGALGFGFGTYVPAYVNQPHSNVEILIPLVLYATAAFVRFGGPWRFGGGMVAVALVALGGHPESMFYALLFGSLYALAEAAVARGAAPDMPATRAWVGPAVMFAGGLGLAAFQILPFLEYLPRAWHIHAPGVGQIHHGATGLVELALPRIVGADFPIGVGPVVLALAGFAVIGIRRLRSRGAFFAAFVLVIGGLMLGIWPFRELGRLPVIGESGNIKYPGPVVTCALAVLGAIGFDRLRAAAEVAARARSFYAVALGYAALAIGGAAWLAASRPAIDAGAVALGAGLVLGAAALVAARRRGAFGSTTLALGLASYAFASTWTLRLPSAGVAGWAIGGAALVLPLVACAWPRVPRLGLIGPPLVAAALLVTHIATDVVTHPAEGPHELPDPANVPAVVQAIRDDAARRDDGPFRILGVPYALPANQATVYGLEDVRSCDALYVERYQHYLNAVNRLTDYRGAFMERLRGRHMTLADAWQMLVADPLGRSTDWCAFETVFFKRCGIVPERFDDALVDLLGVRYLLYYGPPPPITDADHSVIHDEFGYRVVYNRGALPRAFVVRDVEVCATRDALVDRLVASDFRPARTALVEAPLGVPLGAAPIGDADRARVVSRGAHEVVVDVQCREPSLLVLTDTYYPGWQATLAGPAGERSLDIVPTDLAFRGVVVPAGEQRVVFRYRPVPFRVGVWLALGVLAAWVAWVARTAVASRRSTS